MGLSDCIKCWNTPCTCGWDLRNANINSLKKQRELIDKAIKFKETNPLACFSGFTVDETEDDHKFMAFICKDRSTHA